MGQGYSGHRLNTAGAHYTENKFLDRDKWPTKLEEGKQGKHIQGHRNYTSGRSYLTISLPEAQELVEAYSGHGRPIGDEETSTKEKVNFPKRIGFHKNQDTGVETATTWGMIHHSKKGTHLVPALPDEEGENR
jgi:hypothetical protein